VTLGQHHLFMVLLIAFIEDAFLGWRDRAAYQPEGTDAIDLAVKGANETLQALQARCTRTMPPWGW
jgi:hypothetical protein